MAAPTGYPSWVYNSVQFSSLIVANVAQFNALSGAGTWTTTPFVGIPGSVPTDPNLTDTDIRLQQSLIEQRLTNNLLAMIAQTPDDLVAWRQDIVNNDSGLTT